MHTGSWSALPAIHFVQDLTIDVHIQCRLNYPVQAKANPTAMAIAPPPQPYDKGTRPAHQLHLHAQLPPGSTSWASCLWHRQCCKLHVQCSLCLCRYQTPGCTQRTAVADHRHLNISAVTTFVANSDAAHYMTDRVIVVMQICKL